MINKTVENNIERMTGKGPKDMPAVLSMESLGGNAGCWKGRLCGGANFFYEWSSGKILYFTNMPPSSPESGIARAIFRVAIIG